MPFSIIEATFFYSNGDHFELLGYVGGDEGGGYFVENQIIDIDNAQCTPLYTDKEDFGAYVIINSVENFSGDKEEHPDYYDSYGWHDRCGDDCPIYENYGQYRNLDLTIVGDYYSSNLALFYGTSDQAFLDSSSHISQYTKTYATTVNGSARNFNHIEASFMYEGLSTNFNSCTTPHIAPQVHGTNGRDRLIGAEADEDFYGYDLADIIKGGDGDDYIDAGTSVGRKPDRVIGGSGRDTFIVRDDYRVLIKDFNIAEDILNFASAGSYSLHVIRRGTLIRNDHGNQIALIVDILDPNGIPIY